MKKVVISSDRSKLEKFLQDDRQGYFYTSIGLHTFDIEEFFEGRGYKKIDIGEGLNGMDFGNEYVDFIGRLNHDRNSIYWWATTVSYKGNFGSNLCRDIFNYYCAVSLIKRQEGNYIILSDNFVFNSCIKKYCDENAIECRLLDARKRKSNIVYFRRFLKSSAYFLCQGWMRKVLIFIYLSGSINKTVKEKRPYYVIRSWMDDRSFPEGDRYNDLYFGSLPEYLKERGKDFIVVVGILRDHVYRNLVRRIKRIKQISIIPQEYFVGYLDYLRVITLNFINRPNIIKPITFCGLEVTGLVRECLKKDYENNEINKNLIYYYYVKGLLKKVNVHTFIYPYEGHSWERLSILAIRKFSQATRIVGYPHALFYPYLLAFFYSKEEQGIAPLPDKLVTTGRILKMILDESGSYKDKVELSEGCALRYEYLFKEDGIKRNKDGKILVALSMDFEYTVRLLKILCDTLKENNRYKVVLRSHPNTPVEMIMETYNIRMGDNFHISKPQSLKDDITGSSMLIYTNTTVSLEALALGVPVVHVDIKEPMSIDPLYKMNNGLKWTAASRDELSTVIDYIYNMDNEEYLRKYKEARLYLKKCFNPVEERYLKEFVA